MYIQVCNIQGCVVELTIVFFWVVRLNHNAIKKVLVASDLSFDVLFVSFSVLYYYRMYNRCSSFKTPYIPVGNTFPMATSNYLLSLDCTASSSDSFVLIYKAGLFLLKLTIKNLIRYSCEKSAPDHMRNNQLVPGLEQQGDAIVPIFCEYPRQLYQLLLVINIPLFVSLLLASWLPVYNKFNQASGRCPNFFQTGLISLGVNIDLSDCNKEVYKWQRFAWAAQFLWMVIINLTLYQLFKIAYNLVRLCCPSFAKSRSSVRIKSLWSKGEIALSNVALGFLLTESIGVSFILINSALSFPDGLSKLLHNYFTIAYTKVDSAGTVTRDFTDFTVHLTQLDQRLFYGVLPYQLVAVPASFILTYAMFKRRAEHQAVIQTLVGKYLRVWLEFIATSAPLLTAANFFISSILIDSKDVCYLTNFKKTFFHILQPSSEIINPGDKGNCNLYSVAAVLGSSILQTAIMVEFALFIPTALLSLAVISELLYSSTKSFVYQDGFETGGYEELDHEVVTTPQHDEEPDTALFQGL